MVINVLGFGIFIIAVLFLASAPRCADIVEPRAVYTNRAPGPVYVIDDARAREILSERIELTNRRAEVVALRIAVAAASNVLTNRITALNLKIHYLERERDAERRSRIVAQVSAGLVVVGLVAGAVAVLVQNSKR